MEGQAMGKHTAEPMNVLIVTSEQKPSLQFIEDMGTWLNDRKFYAATGWHLMPSGMWACCYRRVPRDGTTT